MRTVDLSQKAIMADKTKALDGYSLKMKTKQSIWIFLLGRFKRLSTIENLFLTIQLPLLFES